MIMAKPSIFSNRNTNFALLWMGASVFMYSISIDNLYKRR